MSVALITGGSRGIGRVIAREFAREGYDIAICYSGNDKAAEETIELCKQLGVQAVSIKADVSSQKDVDDMFAQIKALLGPVSVLVNNAGITKDGLLIRMNEEDFDKVIDINLKGTYLCTKAAIKDMMRAKNGRIININSIVGVQGNAGQANYAASKAGIIGFTKKITVNAIAPGFIQTEMTDQLPEEVKQTYLKQIPLARFGTVEDIAGVATFLASDKASYITGQVIEVTGGM